MRKTTYSDSAHTTDTAPPGVDTSAATSGLPNRLMTAFEVAEFVGCHEETVRRAYLRGLLISQRWASEEGDFIRSMSSTGFNAAHRRESRNHAKEHT